MGGAMFVVFAGRETDVYDTWKACKAQVHRFPKAVHCKFDSTCEAYEAFARLLRRKTSRRRYV